MDRTDLAYQAIRDVFAVEVLELSDEIGRSTGTWKKPWRSREADHLRSAGVTQARNAGESGDQERDREWNGGVPRDSRAVDHW
jgi:hypothetical protein